MSRAYLAALALALAAVTSAGCGKASKSANETSASSQVSTTDSSSASTPVGPPLTRSQLIAKADAICFRVNAKRAASKIHTTESIAKYVPALAAYERTAYAELGKLVPPASMTTEWNELVTLAKTLAAETTKVGQYAQAGNLKAMSGPLVASNQSQQKLLELAQHSGFKDCAQIA